MNRRTFKAGEIYVVNTGYSNGEVYVPYTGLKITPVSDIIYEENMNGKWYPIDDSKFFILNNEDLQRQYPTGRIFTLWTPLGWTIDSPREIAAEKLSLI